MKYFQTLLLAVAQICLLAPHSLVRAETEAKSYDVVVYGGTSAAVSTAVQVKRMGKSVVIVCPEVHLGGLTSGGLGWTDSGNKDAIGGVSREFYNRIWQHYQSEESWPWENKSKFGNRNQSPPGRRSNVPSMWVFEPHVAEETFEGLVSEHEIPVFRNEWLDRTAMNSESSTNRTRGVSIENERIGAIKTLSGKIFQGKMFVDATYEGDLLAAAGVSFHVGREANTIYDEKWNGIQVGVLHHRHHFTKRTDPYIAPGNPSSGLLPGVTGIPPGKKGDGDSRIQAYCFRMCLTNVAENRIPFSKPDGYDASQYELLLRVLDSGWRELFDKFDPMPNHKTDTNNHGPFSTDFIGENYEYPEGTYQQRKRIIENHEVYQKGLMYFMANDPRVPDDVRQAMSKWGLARDEFTDNENWPHQIYVREARRMIGSYVMTEHDCMDTVDTPQSVGMGSYTLDSHNVQRYVKPDGSVQNEGDIGVAAPQPYEIAYGSLIPKANECENLLVPVCVSSSHIAFGSIRMEPVFMILGQSAATAACLSLDRGIPVQELPYDALRERLLADGQVLELPNARSVSVRKLKGTVIDDADAGFQGNWKHSTANRQFVGTGYQHNNNETGEKTAIYRTKLKAGKYEVRISWPANNNRASNVPISIKHLGGTAVLKINQREMPPIDGVFKSLGEFEFGDEAVVEVGTRGTDGYVVTDAIQFLPSSR